MSEPIILYTSSYCMHSRSVERFLEKHDIAARIINIDRDQDARQALIEINKGYASVPTLVFPDGTKLTEPSTSQLGEKLGIDVPSMTDRLKNFLGK
jgi:mycoredoxin